MEKQNINMVIRIRKISKYSTAHPLLDFLDLGRKHWKIFASIGGYCELATLEATALAEDRRPIEIAEVNSVASLLSLHFYFV